MVASQGVNVLRWSALAVGVFYGAYHQSTICRRAHQAEVEHGIQRQKELVEKARAEYAKLHPSPATGVVTDPEDKRFDLEKLLLAKAAEN